MVVGAVHESLALPVRVVLPELEPDPVVEPPPVDPEVDPLVEPEVDPEVELLEDELV